MGQSIRSLQDNAAMLRRRRDRLAERLFTGLNVAVFVVLLGCVAAASVLWETWH